MTSPISALSAAWPTAATQDNPMASARTNVLTAVASELGMSQVQLQAQLQSGKSMAQLATAAGVSSDQLNATITSALQQSNLPAGTDIAGLANKMANHVGGHHHLHADAAASASSTTSTSDPTIGQAGSTPPSGSGVNVYL